MKNKRVLIMAGGTGGHIYPALACAKVFESQGYDVRWLGSKGGMELDLVPQHNIEIDAISIKGVRGNGLKGLLLSPFRILYAVGQSIALVRRFRPSVVLGMGGFVTGPGGVAAKLCSVPLVVHEQNAVAGTTNRLLAKVATRVLQAFSGALPKALTVGNPVRSNIINLRRKSEGYRLGRPLKLLVVGGSLGAQAINELMPRVLSNWSESTRLDVWHQTGKRNIDDVSVWYQEAGVDARVEAYIENMNDAYYWADIVLCRSGAMTISELAIAGLPSILVPYPYAIDDHQTKNAESLVAVDAAKLMPQTELTKESLTALLKVLISDENLLNNMGEAARKVAYPNATEHVVAECKRFIKHD
ncbi:undecaprenyldiphospho-muramoylpentapeptide beta-N-acetylglucosaminyltransferase [Marinomonas sp. 42_23_T18]|nr:undecaprenyldiphospho-muramoylpentapeptide beta-N-acetylglucosaminyltransferase [Marinomonas sp. 42_23_T18]